MEEQRQTHFQALHSEIARNLKNIGRNRRELTDVELELANLRRELAKVKMERDILKKVAAYFAKESI